MTTPDLDRLLGQTYAAAFDIELWPALLVQLADAIGAIGGLFGTVDPWRPERSWLSFGRLDHGLGAKFLHDHQGDPHIRKAATLPILRPVTCEEITPAGGSQIWGFLK